MSGGLTPRGEETLVRLASWMPFAQAQELLEDLVGIQVSKATARRATLATGEAQLSVCEGEVERLKQEVPQAPGGADKQLLSAYGAMVHLVGGEWAEVKTLVMGEVTRTKRGEVCTQQISSFSRLADAEHFAEAALVETHRRGLERAAEVCAVQDGAEWLQGLVDHHRADALRILDFAHAASAVSDIGEAVRGAGGRLPTSWLEGVLHRLKHQGPARVLTHLARVVARYPSEASQEKLPYLQKRENAPAVPDVSRSWLAHWLRERRKCQQGSRRSTPQRGRHALGSTERQSHAGAPQRGLQSAVARDMGDVSDASTSAAHESAAGREPTAADQRLLDPRLLGSTRVPAVSSTCSCCHLTDSC